MRIVTSRQMRFIDRRAIDSGVPAAALMARAGAQVTRVIVEQCGPVAGARVAVLAGRGGNGGDAAVVARLLQDLGSQIVLCRVGRQDGASPEAAAMFADAERAAVDVIRVTTESEWTASRDRVATADLVVDGLCGTGLDRPLDGLMARVVADLNASKRPVVSIDVPSGLRDLPSASDAVVAARLTVALGALKESLLTPIGGEHAGRLFVADIGLPPEAIDAEPAPVVRLATAPVVRAWLPARGPHAHKGTCGHVVVVAGSVGKTGAAHLAALGALRSGAGLVTVATPSSCLSIVASLGAEYMTAALPDDGDGRAAGGAVEVLERLPGVEAWVVGPGLGTTEATARIVAWVAQRGLPVVFDADALPAAAPLLERRRDARPLAVVTPHPGEMARLLGVSTERVQARRVGTALDEARRLGAVVLLKGAFSVTATPHGLAWVNPSGNPGMATAGTGDVLAGIVGGWLAQGLDVEAAAALGAYLHGAAGDRAARRLGEHALMARDLLDDVGPALVELGDAAPDRSIGRVS